MTSLRGWTRLALIALVAASPLVTFPRTPQAVDRVSNSAPPLPRDASAVRMKERYGDLPLAFEPNRGQMDAQVRFVARSQGMSVFFADRETVMVLHREEAGERGAPPGTGPSRNARQSVVRMKLVGAGTPRAARGLETVPGISNYFVGNDLTLWHEGVPHYGRVLLSEVYPGVDLVSYGNQGKLEYDFVVAPGADPGQGGWAGRAWMPWQPQEGFVDERRALQRIVMPFARNISARHVPELGIHQRHQAIERVLAALPPVLQQVRDVRRRDV